ncbi:MAG TPA: AAA family ATPase [Phycisphaerae bacterium]|nr:AAA family ATPase [Phycisphaerae bacterium]
MYLEYYKLTERPFNLTPDTKFLYMTEQHQTALNHLLYGIGQRKGFVLLTGEVGTGKTTLCRKLLASLEGQCHTAMILNPMLTETQLLRAVVEDFGVECPRRDRLAYLSLLNRFLLEVNLAGRNAVLIIDEAQDMSVELLEMTRLLSNLETESAKLLQIVLVGQPELRQKLRSPNLRQLDQRITVRYHLRMMNLAETAEYIRHRLQVAGADGKVRFDEDAIEAVYRHSGGTPRLINAIGDKALLAGYVRQSRLIDGGIVAEALHELKEAA